MAEQRLFISHASEDAAVADKIVAYLEAHGVPCWISSRDIPPQSIYAEEITQGIEDCRSCVVIVSNAANNSAAVKRELELTSHLGKPFIPIRIDNTEPGRGLAYYLRNTQWIDYGRERERALDRIVAHVTGTSRAAPAAVRPVEAPQAAESENRISDAVSGYVWVLCAVAVVAVIAGLSYLNSIMSRPSETYETAATETPTEVAPAEAPYAPSVEERAAAERAAREARLPQGTWISRVRSEPIVPGQTMAGVRIGQPLSEVRAQLGAPRSETDTSLTYGSRTLWFSVWGNGQVEMITLRDDDLLLSDLMPKSRGISIGSTRSQVISAFGNPLEESPAEDDVCLRYPGLLLWLTRSGTVRQMDITQDDYFCYK